VKRGILTGLSFLTVSAASAAAAALLAYRFGRTAETDGFLAAYAVYLLLVIGAQSFRQFSNPELARAEEEGRLGPEVSAYAFSFLVVALPVCLAAATFREGLAGLLTVNPEAARAAAPSLAWVIPAAFLQLFAALLASALAARDSYLVTAVGYAAGGLAGLIAFAVLAPFGGVVALAWGVMVNGALTVAVLGAGFRLKGGFAPGGKVALDVGRRLGILLNGSAMQLALQLFYLVSIRTAAGLGIGQATSFSYAYLLAAVLVTTTASSLALVSSTPLTRRGLTTDSAAQHVVHLAWFSLALIAAAVGSFFVGAGSFAGLVLGAAFAGAVGDQIGLVVLALAPWMIATVAFAILFPLLFVARRDRHLLPFGVIAVVFHVPVTLVLAHLLALPGIALAIALSTALTVGMMAYLFDPGLPLRILAGLFPVVLVEGGLAAVCFGAAHLVNRGIAGAGVGLIAFAIALVALRPAGLRASVAYVRGLD